jgi:hypothetical protein
MINRDRGQQEIVGFVLIVVLVVVGLMVFLVISMRGGGEDLESVRVSNILDVLMRTTTECAIVYEPDYDTFEDLFKSCYGGKICSNLGRDACDYLNESLADVVDGMMMTESGVVGWGIYFVEKDDDGEVGILKIEDWGNCSGGVSGAQRSIVSGGDKLIVRMRVCSI